MFRIPDGIDPKVKAVLQVIQGEFYKLAKRGTKGGGAGGSTTYTVVGGGAAPGIPTETSGDQTIHGNLYVDGIIDVGAVSGDLDRLTTVLTAWEMVLSDDATDITLTFDTSATDVLGIKGTTPIFEFGASNTILGQDAGAAVTTATALVLIGYDAGYKLIGGINNVLIGNNAGYEVTTGSGNIMIGRDVNASGGTDPDNNVVIGYQAGYNISGNNSVLVGHEAGYTLAGGQNNVMVGYQAGYLCSTGSQYNVLVGYQAGYNMTGHQQVMVGYQAGYPITTGEMNTIVGYLAGASAGIDADRNVLIGHSAGYVIEADYCILVGMNAGKAITTGSANVVIGYEAALLLTTGTSNVVVGHCAGAGCGIDADYNVLVGANAGNAVSGNSNVMIGNQAGLLVTTGQDNVMMGAGANASGGIDPDANVIIGYRAGYNVEGNNSVLVGYQAGHTLAANGACVMIGYQAGYSETLVNMLYIANTNTATPLIGGVFPNTSLTFTTNIVTIDTAADAGAEALCIKQDDADQPFIKYDGTAAADAANNVSTWTAGNAIQGFVRVDVEGTDYWMPYYDAPTS